MFDPLPLISAYGIDGVLLCGMVWIIRKLNRLCADLAYVKGYLFGGTES